AHFGADGVVVEAAARGQFEVMLGAHRDPQFGAMVMVGSGGSMVEYLDDTALRAVRYMDPEDPAALLRATRIGAYLGEHSPQTAQQLAAVAWLVARWFAGNPQLSGLDLNPLVVDVVT